MIITREQGLNIIKTEFRKHLHLQVNYATGYGKTNGALSAIADVWGYDSMGMFVCHSTEARDITIPNDMEKWHPRFLGQPRVCYDSLFKFDGYVFDWVVLDEAHYLTPEAYSFFSRNTVKSIICLTAIPPEDSEKRAMINELTKGHRIMIPLDQAVQNKVLTDYTIAVWEVELTPEEWKGYLGKCEAFERARRSRIDFKIQQAGLDRQRYLSETETKIKAAMYIRDRIREKGKRFVMYSGTKQVCELLSPYVFHYESGVKDFKRFLKMEIDELSCIKKMKESANVENLGSALVEQLNSKQLDLIQMLGRLMRLPVGEIARMHILVAKNTMDVSWLQSATKSINKAKIHHKSLSRELFQNIQIS